MRVSRADGGRAAAATTPVRQPADRAVVPSEPGRPASAKDWTQRAVCRTRPADWWDLGDDGNRLALLLCSVCPVLRECAPGRGDREHGVIRAGVAWSDDGKPVAICACGRPALGRPLLAECFTCFPPENLPVPSLRGARVERGLLDKYAPTIANLLARQWSYERIGEGLGLEAHTVRYVARRHGLQSSLVGRPKAA